MVSPVVSGVRISAYYEVSVVEPDGGDTLRMLTAAVGGYVDVIALPGGIDMWVADEALIRGYEINGAASHVIRVLGGEGTISGPVVFASSTAQGDTIALSPGQIQILTGWVPVLLRSEVVGLLSRSDCWTATPSANDDDEDGAS